MILGKTHKIKNEYKTDNTYSFSINNEFNPFTLISSFVSYSIQTESKSGSVFFNISVHAPFEILNSTLFSLFICGSLNDYSNGLIFTLPQISPEWRFIIEVPYSRTLGAKLEENVAHILPVIAILAVAEPKPEQITDKSYPLRIDKKEKLVAKFLKAYDDKSIDRLLVRDQNGREQEVIFPDLTDVNECRRIIDDCIQKHIDELPKNKIIELSFIEFLYRRVQFFNGFFYRTNESTKHLGSIAMEQMLEEVKSLIQIDFSKNDFSRVYFVYDEGFSLLLLHNDWNRVNRDVKGLFGNHDPSLTRSLGTKNYHAQCLAWLVGINYNTFMKIVKETRFILTEHFVYKLFHIHERKLTRLALIIEGETGVGKTFLLNFYASLLNAQSSRDAAVKKMVPRILENSGLFLLDIIRANIEIDQELVKRFLQRIENDIANAKTFYEERFSQNALGSASTIVNEQQNLIDVGERGKAILDSIKTKLVKEEYDKYHLYQIWSTILIVANQQATPTTAAAFIQMMHNFISTELINYPLIDASQSLINLLQDTDSPSADVSIEIFREYLFQSKTKPMFYRLLIHPGITEEQLIEFMNPIAQLARDLSYAEIVIFFDEVNTSSCLGLFKEMFMDGTLRGDQIPKNIFFTAAINPKTDSSTETMMKIHRTDYNVHELPQSLKDLKVKYGAFDAGTLADYIFKKIEVFQMATTHQDGNIFSLYQNFERTLADAIITAHEFCMKKLGK